MPTQTRTNHLGYDAGSSRKTPTTIALARSATTKFLEADTSSAFTLLALANALTLFALTLFRFLCFGFGTVKAALKATAATITMRPVDSGGSPPTFQIQVKVDGATVMLDAGSAWTAADVKAALHAKTGRADGGYYLVAAGGKPLNDGAATTLAALGVGPGEQLELRGRLRGGMGCGRLTAALSTAASFYSEEAAVEKATARAARAAERAAAEEKAEEKAQEEKAAEEKVVVACAGKVAVGSPPMTAQQQVEKEKEVELIAAQMAKPSYWDEVGQRKPNASALKRALADTVLVDAAWLARLADEGGVLPRCQDLPPGARVTLEEMEKWKDGFTVGVLVISYPWWAPPHSTPA